MPQRREMVLLTLLKLYREFRRAVQFKEIMNATKMGKDMIRKELEILKCLDLIESRPGRKGGYVPTMHAYGAGIF